MKLYNLPLETVYQSLRAFVQDCRQYGYNPRHLLEIQAYGVMFDQSVIAL